MAKNRQIPNLKTWLTIHLRNVSKKWPGKNFAKDKAKVKTHVGTYLNGNPKYLNMFRCAECERQGIDKLWRENDVQADHIIGVVGPEGFKDWNTYIERMFCPTEGYQILCSSHHDEKTAIENLDRQLAKNLKKIKKST